MNPIMNRRLDTLLPGAMQAQKDAGWIMQDDGSFENPLGMHPGPGHMWPLLGRVEAADPAGTPYEGGVQSPLLANRVNTLVNGLKGGR